MRIFPNILLVILFATEVFAVDWSDCASELDRLRRASRDAADYAETANSIKDEVESKKDDLQNCIAYPDTYDHYGDKCQSQRWDYESALSDYESAVSSVESELDTVVSRIKSVGWSCTDSNPSHSTGANSSNTKDPGCDIYQQYKGKLPDNSLLDLCKKKMSEGACKKCLNIK